jgi:hypothetical protein
MAYVSWIISFISIVFLYIFYDTLKLSLAIIRVGANFVQSVKTTIFVPILILIP